MGTVTGVVQTSQEQPIPGAVVRIRYLRPVVGFKGGAALQSELTFTANDSGAVVMPDLIPGHYGVEFRAGATGAVILSGGGTVLDDDAQTLQSFLDSDIAEITPSALQQAAAAAAAAEADRVQTGADRVQTGLDRVQTGLDRIETGLDRIETGLLRQAAEEAADRVDLGALDVAVEQTGLDAQATAADRVQTGLDRQATGEDLTATLAARDATELAALSKGYFPTVAAGEAALDEEDVFHTVEGDLVVYYQIISGTAEPIPDLALRTASSIDQVDNTRDADKPVSGPQQAAIDALIDTKGAPNGFAGLDSSARVPAAQLPIADQPTAETGTAASLVMSPQRTTQHFNARVGGWLRASGFLSAIDQPAARESLGLPYADDEAAVEGTAIASVLSPRGATLHYNARVGGWVRTSNLLQSTSALAFLAALGGKQAPAIDAADDQIRALAELGDDRGQAAEASAQINADQLNIILSRLAAAEAIITQLYAEADSQMTTYPLAATIGTSASVLVPSATVQRLQVLNRSDEATIGIAFGAPPAGMSDAGLVTLAPGAALDTQLIAGAPVYAIASAAGTEVSGAFAVSRGDPNPNWEADFQALVAGMGSAPVYAWEMAYRRLYSALRREGILSRTRGLFIPVAHAEVAATQNWAAPGTYMTALSEPVFAPGAGFDYDGTDDAHNTGLMLNGWTTSLDLAAIVWTGADDQITGRVAMGDGATAIQANRSPTQAALNTGTTNADVVSIPYLGAMLGFTRTLDDRATVLRPGGRHTTVFRTRIMTLPGRNMHIGANNSSAGVGDFYDGVVKAAYFGRSLTDRQILAFEVAMNDYFDAAAKAQAGV